MLTETLEEFPQWPRIFAKRRQFNRKAENQTYIEWLQTQNWVGEDDEYGEGDEDEDDLSGDDENSSVLSEQDEKVEKDDQDGEANNRPSEVRVFMTGLTGDEDALPYRDQVEEVASFCEQAKVRDVGNKPVEGGKHKVLLDDRNIRGTVLVNKGLSPPGECRPYLGPLTSQQLDKELRKKRFPVTPGTSEDEEIDAERRTVFMTDLDPSTIKAIATTASRTQAPALKDLFYKHLTGKTSIGVTIPYQGFAIYSLDFHIPFYVLKVGQELFKDTRSRADGTPLRQCWDLPFMSASTGVSTSMQGRCCLYEAQISIAVTGIDHWVWAAYAIVDIYVESGETVDIYDQLTRRSRRRGQRRRPDPLAAGRIVADEPIWTPREYFLKVIEIRMNQVLREWNFIVDEVERDIKQSVLGVTLCAAQHYLDEHVACTLVPTQAFQSTNHIFPISPSSNDPKSQRQLREFSSKNTNMVRLLRQLISGLSTTVEAWAEFKRRDIGYFRPEGEPPPTSPPLKPLIAALEKTFWKLNDLRGKLQKLKKELCEDNPLGLHAHLSIENNEAAHYQQKAAGNIEVLTVITIFFFPLVLAANLFSTTGVLPFKPSFANFICAMIILAILVLATLVVLSKWRLWLEQIVEYAQRAIIWYNERQVVEVIDGGLGASPKSLTQKLFSRRNTNDDIEMATLR